MRIKVCALTLPTFDARSAGQWKIDIERPRAALGFTRDRLDDVEIEYISLRDVDEVEEDAAETGVGIAWNTTRLRLKRHGAGGDFMETVINSPGFADIRER